MINGTWINAGSIATKAVSKKPAEMQLTLADCMGKKKKKKKKLQCFSNLADICCIVHKSSAKSAKRALRGLTPSKT